MRIQVAGRQIDVGEALRTRIEADFEAGIKKYFPRPTEGVVTVSKNGVGFEVDCMVHLASGISLQAHGSGGDAHSAFDDALGKMEKRVRRYKRRLKNHHADNKAPLPAEEAPAFVLAPLRDEDLDDDSDDLNDAASEAPLVIAESTTHVRTMTVAMAVLQLDLMEAPCLLFRNSAHGGLNFVYKRGDGNVGWVDPDRKGAASAA
jgi:ribosomal subunit interface protein